MQQARRSERDFTRERALPLQRLVPLLLNFRKGTNRDELEQFFETITDDPTSVTPVSEAAFCRARQKLKPEALVTLNNVLLDSANQQIAQQRWRGLRVLAVDGSTGRLPDFLAIEEYFGKPSGSGVPLARFSRLFDVLLMAIYSDPPTANNFDPPSGAFRAMRPYPFRRFLTPATGGTFEGVGCDSQDGSSPDRVGSLA